jgi:hypothetical protein
MEGIAAIRARVQAIQSQFGTSGAGGVLGGHDASTSAEMPTASTDSFAAALASAQSVDPSVPTSSGKLNKAGVDPTTWARDFLTKAGLPITSENVRAVEAWQQAEGTAATFNPLATTQGGYAGSTNFNSVGVKNFVSYQDGIDANAKVLNNGLYPNIIAALKKGDSALDVALAIKDSPWGSGALVEKIIRGQS